MEFEKDRIPTNSSPIDITFIGHGALMIKYDNAIIHVDPWSKLADYSNLPAADLILITHEHPDHLDTSAIKMLYKGTCQIICTRSCFGKLKKITDKLHVLKNGDTLVADAALGFRPAILYPYHFGKTDTSLLTTLLRDSEIDVRIRNMS